MKRGPMSRGSPAADGLAKNSYASQGPARSPARQGSWAGAPRGMSLDQRPAGHCVHVSQNRNDLDERVLQQILDPLLHARPALDEVGAGPGEAGR